MPQVLTQALQSIKALAKRSRLGQISSKEVITEMKIINDRITKDLKSESKPEVVKKEEKKEESKPEK